MMDLGPRGLPLRKQRQYVHRSGNALVTIDRRGQTLGFVTNYLALTKRWFGTVTNMTLVTPREMT